MKRRMSRKASSQVFLIILLILPLTVYYVVLHSKINNNNDVVLWKGAGSNNNDNEEEEDIRNLLITTSAYYDNNDNNAGIIINRTITTTTNNLDSTSNEKEKGGIIIISDTEVRNLFYLWNDALETLDPDIVTRRYSTKRRAATVLLPTGSNIPRTDYQSIRSYFVDFLKKKPTCKILDSHVYIQEGNGGRWCMDVGIYEFVFQTTGEKMKARYTFVYVFEKEEDDDGEWKILHHHSSVMPEEASETEETETDAVIVGGGDEDTERNNNIVVHETNNNLIPNNIIVGKTYNVNSTPCWLSPQWGSTSTTTTSNTTNSSYEEICLGSTISNPSTSARQLTCIHDNNNNNNNNNNENLNKPQRRTRSDDTNNLTIGLLYYMKPSQLLRQIEMIQSYPIEIQRNLTLLIIDDCSPNGLTAYEYVKKILPQHFKIRIARILIDLQFNHGGARNLACYLSETSKIILLDLDLLIDNTMIQQLMEFQLVEEEASEEVVPEKPTLLTATATNNNNNNNASNMLHNVIPPPPQQQQRSIISVAHRFNRILPPQVTSKAGGGDNDNNNNNNIETRLHPAVMLLNVSTYWQNGGCDEDFVGSYGFTDMHYWYKWRMDYTRKKVVDHTEIYLKEFQIPGCNFTSLTKIQPSIDSILKAEGEGGSSSSEISIVDKCTKALMKLKQNKPKRKPKINNERLKTKKISGCWSNRYLRFPWKLIL